MIEINKTEFDTILLTSTRNEVDNQCFKELTNYYASDTLIAQKVQNFTEETIKYFKP
jgi:hypothetical protein